MHSRQNPHAPALLGRVNQWQPYREDQRFIAIGFEIAGILVPGNHAVSVVGDFGTKAVDAAGDDFLAAELFGHVQQFGMRDEMEKCRAAQCSIPN